MTANEHSLDGIVFAKYQALGNDFIVVDAREHPELVDDWPLARLLLDRHFGAGADGCIFVLPSTIAHVRMRIRTPAGGWLPMCGNGIRCLTRYLHDTSPRHPRIMRVETDAGVRDVEWLGGRDQLLEADLLAPDLRAGAIPTTLADPERAVIEQPLDLGTLGRVTVTCVNVGNPHAVIFVPDLESIDMHTLGNAVEHHPAFPEGVNVQVAQVLGRDRALLRTWERGAGLTLA
jgi:diaminopimelate epimerase